MATSARRGFSLLVVIMIVALLSIASLVVLDTVTEDQSSAGYQRKRLQARVVAEGAVMEIANDTQVVDTLPGLSEGTVTAAYSPSSESAYIKSAGIRSEETYEANIKHVRFVPVLESSISRVTAMVYEVETTATIDGGDATGRIDAEVYRVVGLPSGKVLPRVHAR